MPTPPETTTHAAPFARFFVRFHGFVFLFWVIHDLLGFPIVYDNFRIVHEHALRDAVLAREFLIYLARIALQLFATAILLGRTEKVITFVLTGRWCTVRPTFEPGP